MLGNKKQKQKVVLLEGADPLSVTILGDLLSKELELKLIRNNYISNMYWSNSNKGYFEDLVSKHYLAEFLRRTGFSVVVDGSHITNYVQSKYNNKSLWISDILKVEKIFCCIEAKVAYCGNSKLKYDFPGREKDKFYKQYFQRFLQCELIGFDESCISRSVPGIEKKAFDNLIKLLGGSNCL